MCCLFSLSKINYWFFLIFIFSNDYIDDIEPLIDGVHVGQSMKASDDDIEDDCDDS